MTHVKVSDLTDWLEGRVTHTLDALGPDQSEASTIALRGSLRAYRAMLDHLKPKKTDETTIQLAGHYSGAALDPTNYLES